MATLAQLRQQLAEYERMMEQYQRGQINLTGQQLSDLYSSHAAMKKRIAEQPAAGPTRFEQMGGRLAAGLRGGIVAGGQAIGGALTAADQWLARNTTGSYAIGPDGRVTRFAGTGTPTSPRPYPTTGHEYLDYGPPAAPAAAPAAKKFVRTVQSPGNYTGGWGEGRSGVDLMGYYFGGGAGGFGAQRSAFQQAFDANQNRYMQALSLLRGSRNAEVARVMREGRTAQSRARQNLYNRGLAGSTAVEPTVAAVGSRFSEAAGMIRGQVARDMAGVIERVQDVYPDDTLDIQAARLRGRLGR